MKLRTLLKAPVLVQAGYGVHSRQIFQALTSDPLFDVFVEPLNWGNCSHIVDDSQMKRDIKHCIAKRQHAAQNGQENWDLFVHVTVPNEFERKARINVGVTAGIETDRCSPQWIQKCNEMDLLIVPSKHAAVTLANIQYDAKDQNGNATLIKLAKPLAICSEGFDSSIFKTLTKEEFEKETQISSLDFPTEFNFLHVGQWGNGGFGEDRKNIALMVKYFIEAFFGRKDVGLVLKVNMSKNSEVDQEHVLNRLKQIKANYPQDKVPPIYLVHGTFTEQEMSALYNHPKIKSFVSFTHGEGFGLPLLEAAGCKLPVIATNWSGHLDFLKSGLFSHVDYDLKEIPPASVWEPLLMKGSRWAEVREEEAKRRLKRMVDSHKKPVEWAEALQKHVVQNFDVKKTNFAFSETIKTFLNVRKFNPLEDLKKAVDTPNSFNVIYTMPMSSGDVFISTAIINGLKKELPDDSKIYFATLPQYAEILKNNPDVYKVIDWNEHMMNVEMLEEVFDIAYVPNIETQYIFSNFVRKGQRTRLLAEAFAQHCDVQEMGDYFIELDPFPFENGFSVANKKYMTLHVGSGKDQWKAREYVDWPEVVMNLKNLYPELIVVQVGAADDFKVEGTNFDFRGLTKTPQNLAFLIKNACLHVGIDSFPMHLAAAMKTPLTAIFGCSVPTSSGPWVKDLANAKYILLSSERKSGCVDRPCYKHRCKVNPEGNGPINEIDPHEIFDACVTLIEGQN